MLRQQVCKEKWETILVLKELTMKKRRLTHTPMFTMLGETDHDRRKQRRKRVISPDWEGHDGLPGGVEFEMRPEG